MLQHEKFILERKSNYYWGASANYSAMDVVVREGPCSHLHAQKASGHGKEIVYVKYDTTDTRIYQLLPLLVIKESISPAFNKISRHKVEQESFLP